MGGSVGGSLGGTLGGSLRRRPLRGIVDLTVVVADLCEMERSLNRAVEATPVASRMPTPLGSLLHASRLARVRGDLLHLSAHASPQSPLPTPLASLAASAASAASRGAPSPAGHGKPGRQAANAQREGERWPRPTQADLEDDAHAVTLPAHMPARGGRAAKRGAGTPMPARRPPSPEEDSDQESTPRIPDEAEEEDEVYTPPRS